MNGRPPPRFQSDQRLGFGPCRAETRTGRPCTNYAVALLITVGGLAAMWAFLMLVATAYGVTA